MGVYLSNLNYSSYQLAGENLAKGESAEKILGDKAQENFKANTPLDQDKVDITPRHIQGNNLEDKAYSAKEKQDLERLKAADREVKAHERAHRAAAGQYARGGINYRYAVGPDGKQYAIGGDVDIDASKISGDPEATARKMAQVKRAALAPLDPSPQDRKVAALAARMEASALADAAKQAQKESETERSEEEEASKEIDAKRKETGRPQELGLSADEAVNEFKKGIKPELVSNLFDLLS